MEKKKILSLSVKEEEAIVRHEFSQQELQERKDEFMGAAMALQQLKDEKAAFIEQYKADTKPLEKKLSILMAEVRQGYEDSKQLVNLIPNEDDKTFEMYDADGIYVGKRIMTREERKHYTVLDQKNA